VFNTRQRDNCDELQLDAAVRRACSRSGHLKIFASQIDYNQEQIAIVSGVFCYCYYFLAEFSNDVRAAPKHRTICRRPFFPRDQRRICRLTTPAASSRGFYGLRRGVHRGRGGEEGRQVGRGRWKWNPQTCDQSPITCARRRRLRRRPAHLYCK